MQSRRTMEPCKKPAAAAAAAAAALLQTSNQKDVSAGTSAAVHHQAAAASVDASCRKRAKDHGKVAAAERLRCDAPDQECERERLKRHRREMAGRVWVPETWGQEAALKDWAADCTALDRSLFPKGLRTAKEALVEECTRAKLRIGNRC